MLKHTAATTESSSPTTETCTWAPPPKASSASPATATTVLASHTADGRRRSRTAAHTPVKTGDRPIPTAVLTATPPDPTAPK